MQNKLLSGSLKRLSFYDYAFKFVLIGFIVLVFGFAEAGLLPIATLLLMVMIFIGKWLNPSVFKINKLPIELNLLNLWMLFSFFTGYFVAVDQAYFFDGMSKIFFYITIANIIAILLLCRIELINTIMLGILLAGVVHVVAIYLGFGSDYADRTGRAIGVTSNPNSLGLRMVYALAALLFFIIIRRTKIKYFIFYLILFVVFFKIILLSGSRKSLLAIVFFVLGFFSLFFTRNCIKIKISTIFIFILILALMTIIMYFVLPVVLDGTAVGTRIEMGNDRGGVEGDIRYEMYLYSIELLANNPFAGVGINNFRSHFWSGQFSHSDYAESMSSTGVFGFILYQSVYLIVLIRSLKLFFTVKDKIVRLYVGMAFLFIMMLKVIGTGIILFYSPGPLIILAMFSVLTMQIKKGRVCIIPA